MSEDLKHHAIVIRTELRTVHYHSWTLGGRKRTMRSAGRGLVRLDGSWAGRLQFWQNECHTGI